jgi:hypothetical protein
VVIGAAIRPAIHGALFSACPAQCAAGSGAPCCWRHAPPAHHGQRHGHFGWACFGAVDGWLTRSA